MDLVTPTETLFAFGAHRNLRRWREARDSRDAQAAKRQGVCPPGFFFLCPSSAGKADCEVSSNPCSLPSIVITSRSELDPGEGRGPLLKGPDLWHQAQNPHRPWMPLSSRWVLLGPRPVFTGQLGCRAECAQQALPGSRPHAVCVAESPRSVRQQGYDGRGALFTLTTSGCRFRGFQGNCSVLK